MPEAPHHELIIVRRHEEEEHEHHSSAWKVAHADFMTAMMAFFLIMWLINVTDDEIRKGISQYFNPIHMSGGSSDLKGLNRADDKAAKEGKQKGYNDMPMPGQGFNPLHLAAGAGDAKVDAKSLTPEQAAKAIAEAAKAAAKAAEAAQKEHGSSAKGPKDAGAGKPHKGAAPGEGASAAEGDRAAFADPFTVLTKLADEYTVAHPRAFDPGIGDAGRAGGAPSDADRDPFDRAYWQREQPAAADAAPIPAPPGAKPEAPPKAEAPAKVAELPAMPKGTVAPAPDTLTRAETEARNIATEIGQSVKEALRAEASPDLTVKATPEGTLISLTDEASYSMFRVGSAVPDPKVVVLMEQIGRVLAGRSGKVVIRGYTDGRPFRSADYDNWRLSAARAQMAHYMLLRGGLDDSRIAAIEGRADRDLKNPRDPFAAENRRIDILLKVGS